MSESNQTYLQKRLSELGVTSESQYTITNIVYGSHKEGEDGFKAEPFQLFQSDADGNIRIYYPTLDGQKIQWKPKDTKWSKDFYITRLLVPKGDMKYAIPKGAGTHPFFPPNLIRKYQDKEKIKTLFLTEGAFKAFKGDMHGIDIVGLTSITHAKDKITQGLHPDIIRLMRECSVERVVWLVDGDCNRLSSKPIEQIEDLYKRPNQFFSSVVTFRQFMDDFDIEKWFVHPLSDELDSLNNPKGLDDLLVAVKGNEQDVVDDLNNFSKKGNWQFFHKIDIRTGINNVRKYFHIGNVDDFFFFHADRRPELKQVPFVYHGSKYQFDEQKNACVLLTPAEVKNYFRVGDTYYEKVVVPNKYGQLEKKFSRRMKSTIMDDYGKTFVTQVPKYKEFCNFPDHVNYQEIIHNCYNVYGPFEHEPEPGDYDVTMEFLKHIFGTRDIPYFHPELKEDVKINELDLGLDYIQILYQQPTQMLPILCLVSRENGTGKSTLGKWLKMIFTLNAATVGNADLANDFNASWSTKLLVICDEAKIDKQIVVEKVKALSTADKIFINSKGKDQTEIDFFAKFIFNSNNEDNFIYASEDDVRYWVRKIPKITKPNVHMLKQMEDEIPHFLHFLNNRKLVTPNVHRAWFDPELIKTEALQKVIQNSRPTIEKEIRARIREMFLEHPVEQILMAAKDINEEFFRGKYEANYVRKTLSEEMRIPMLNEGTTTVRYVYPRLERKMQDGHVEQVAVEVKCIGRPYQFDIDRFLLPDEIAKRGFILDQNKYANSIPGSKEGELPF